MRSITWNTGRSPLLCGVVIASVAACSRSEPRPPADATAVSATVAAATVTPAVDGASRGARIAVAQNAGVGSYLTDGSGRSVYLFLKDVGDSSSCYGACAAAWPPVVTTGRPLAADSAVRTDLLGMSGRSDGSTQATYGGAPLYYYEDDEHPGDIEGEDKDEFGGRWYLVSPAGGRQERRASPPAPARSPS
jgi:predicted lipoprotein with Yx(FWY)xxD motif